MHHFQFKGFVESVCVSPSDDLACLSLFRRTIEENRALVRRSGAMIVWSHDAGALLERLQTPWAALGEALRAESAH